jgi:hypothetical protein
MVALCTGLSLLLSADADAAKWSAQSLTVAGSSQSELFGIDCYSSTACTAVGHDNTGHWGSFGETWNGSSWTQASGIKHDVLEKNDALRSVSCISATTCVAVGEYGFGVPYPLAQTQSETGWKVWEVGMPKGATQADLNDVSCLEPSGGGIWCMAVGYKMVSGDDKPYAVNFNGVTWTEAPTTSEHNSTLKGVSCLSTSFCIAVGSTTPTGSTGELLDELWEGKASEEKWIAPKEQPLAAGSGTEPVLNGVDCIEQTGKTEETEGPWCLAVGKIKRSPGGSQPIAPSWHRVTGGKYQWYSGSELKHESSSEVIPDGISCRAVTECWAVGEANTGSTKQPWGDKWNNEGWEKAESIPLATGSTGAQLHDISCYAELSCKAVGWSLFTTPTALVDTSTP